MPVAQSKLSERIIKMKKEERRNVWLLCRLKMKSGQNKRMQ
jgi:hypothetical protein